MKKNKRVIFNGAFLLIVFVLTIYGVFHGEDLGAMMDAIRSADKRWLVPGLALVAFFIWGESIIIWYMMRSYGIKLKKRTCFLFSSVGFFFSCITPSASGGQPMQAYYMKKKNISIPVSAVILMIITITYKLVLVVVGIGVAVFGRGFLHQYLEGILPVFYLGLGLNIFCVTFMTILVFHPLLARSFLVWGLSILEKFRILRHKEGRLKKLEDSMDTYRDTAAYLKTHPRVIVNIIAITFVQRMAMFAVTWFVYKAFSLSGTGFWTVLFLQAVISVSVDMLPLPGGMGISETLFLTIFTPVFGTLLLPGMVLSRGLGYYGELLISALFTIVAQLTIGQGHGKENKESYEDEKSFGIQIDSLCDIVCFGIFPIILGYKLGMCKAYSIAILAFYGMAGVIRLAYVNVMEAKRQSETSENRKYYQGLPITSMAVIMPLLFVASVFFPGFRYFVGLLHAAMLIVGFLFIFNFRFRKPTNQELVVLVAVVAVAVLFILFYKEGWWAHYHTVRKLKGAAA